MKKKQKSCFLLLAGLMLGTYGVVSNAGTQVYDFTAEYTNHWARDYSLRNETSGNQYFFLSDSEIATLLGNPTINFVQTNSAISGRISYDPEAEISEIRSHNGGIATLTEYEDVSKLSLVINLQDGEAGLLQFGRDVAYSSVVERPEIDYLKKSVGFTGYNPNIPVNLNGTIDSLVRNITISPTAEMISDAPELFEYVDSIDLRVGFRNNHVFLHWSTLFFIIVSVG